MKVTERTYSKVGISRLYFQLGENPDAVRQLDRLIQHVLSLNVPFRHREYVVIPQFLRHGVCIDKQHHPQLYPDLHNTNYTTP